MIRSTGADEDIDTEGLVVEEQGEEWSYEGPTGPAHWGGLEPEWALCADGPQQSPIDLAEASDATVAPIDFGYLPSGAAVANNGHAIEVALEDAGTVTVRGTSYDLDQFHFHLASEHTVAGRRFPAEMHLVHTNAELPPVVIGVLIDEGEENAALRDALADVPTESGQERALASEIDPSELLPDGGIGRVYRYEGSLTTPPCTEGVLWTVYEQPIELSTEQIEALSAAFPDNSRPIQPLGDRELIRGPLGT